MAVILTGVAFYLLVSIEESHKANLRTIANIRVQQIDQWVLERHGDASALTGDATFMRMITDSLQGRQTAVSDSMILARLNAVQTAYGYSGISVVTRDGERVLSVGKNIDLGGDDLVLLKQAMDSGNVVLSNLHDDSTQGRWEIDLIAPFNPQSQNQAGAIYFHIDPQSHFLPFLWDTLNSFGQGIEVLLVAQDGESVRYFNKLQHVNVPLFSFTMPLNTPNLAGAHAVRGAKGFFLGNDYTGTSVFAELRQISGTPWHLVVIENANKIRNQWLLILVMFGGFLLIAFFIREFWLTTQKIKGERDWYRHLSLEKQRFNYFTKYANDAIILMDADLRIIEVNDCACHYYGYSERELLGLSFRQLRCPQAQLCFDADMGCLKTLKSLVLETEHQRKDGRVFPVESSLCMITTDDGLYFQAIVRDISERKKTEESLLVAEERWKFALESAGDGVWDWNFQTGETYFSPRCKEILGYDLKHGDERILRWKSSIHPDDYPGMMTALQAHREGEADSYQYEYRARTRSNDWVWLLTRGKVIARDANGKALRMIGTQTDISERKKTEESLRLAALVFQNSSEGVTITDADGTILAVNPAFTELTGYSQEEVVGKNPNILSSGRQDAAFYQSMWKQLIESGHWSGEVWNRRKSGEFYAEWLSINTSYNPDGSAHRRVGLFSDITQRKQSDELIWRQAHYDPLTELPNRSMFRDHLEQAIKKADRTKLSVALLFIDLDHFKQVNDTLGHIMGDELLKDATERLSRCVRDTDTVARLGGDEFAVILSEVSDIGGIERVIQDILQSIAEPYRLGTELAYISASIGVSLYPKDSDNIDELLKNADQAMYGAKDQGRNRHCYFAHSMQEAAQNRLQLTTDMRVALSDEQFQVYYQPIVDVASGELIKAEALIRWQHPTRGLINPEDFIPFAEDSGLIIGIGRWILHTACAQTMAWREQSWSLPQITVNVSARQFYEGNFKDVVQEVLDKTQLPPEDLELEITESMLMHDMVKAVSTVQDLWKVGVHISEDDFGTGYSSLNYLKKFPVHTLKIDRSFVSDIGDNPDDSALVAAIITIAHSMHLKVVAEGVETEQQLEFLRQQGCNYCQGFLFAKPMSAQEFEVYLAASLKH
ncbi:MAG: EAL domain-containing protein [Methylococcaceae bacterium]